MSRSPAVIVAFAAVSLSVAGSAAAAEPTARVLTPDEVVRLAIDHDPALAAAVAELERSKLGVDGQEARYTPTFTSEVAFAQQSSPNLGRTGVTVGSRNTLDLSVGLAQQFAWGTSVSGSLGMSRLGLDFSQPGLDAPIALGPGYGLDLSLNIDQPLLRGLGRTLYEADLQVAKVSRIAARTSRDEAASSAVQAVLAAYWDLWYAQAAVDIQERAKATAVRRLDEAEAKLGAGAEAPLNLLPLKSEVASMNEALATARSEVKRARAALARLVGLPMYGGDALQASAAAPDLTAAIPDVAQASEAAVATAFSLASLRSAVEQAKIQASVAHENTKLQLDANAWVQVSGLGNDAVDDAVTMFGGFEAVSAGVGLRLELPVDRTQVQADAAMARLAVKRAEKNLQAASEQLTQQVVELVETASAAQAQLELATETVRLARATVVGQQTRFDSGAGTALELVMAEQDLREAELRQARAQVSLESARLSLAHLTGGLLPTVAEASR